MKQLPWGVQTDVSIVHQADKWCTEQWGPRWEAVGNREGSWCVFWNGPRRNDKKYNMYQWWFETEEQQLWFILKWT